MGTIKINLADTLFSKAQQRVLALFYTHPGQSFHTNDVIRSTHSGTGAIHRELKRLAATGLVTVTRIGNQNHYQANQTNPLYSELRGIVLKTFGLADVLREALKPVASQIHIAFIYGSVAKQEDTVNSDIDLMLLSDNLTYTDLFQLLQHAESQLGRSVNPTFYSLAEWEQKVKNKNNFLIQVLKQPKIFLIGTESELAKLG